MLYKFKGTSVIRVTVNGQDVCLTPNEEIIIDKPNDYIDQLVTQKLLEEIKPTAAE